MKKLKLNIQYFASTNSTTHYNLSQYIATDKPTYLVDYNGDMLKIDTAIYNAMSKATVNEANIGTMTDLTTTAKTSLVNAINEINTQLGANTTNIGTNTSNIATLGTNMGDLVNLMTVAKNNLVSAINELKGVNDTQNSNIQELQNGFEKFNFTNFKAYPTNEITASQGTISYSSLTVASNSDGSIGKIYGQLTLALSNVTGKITLTFASNLRPSSEIYINSLGSLVYFTSQGITNLYSQGLTVKTTGEIEIDIDVDSSITRVNVILIPALLFMKDFGDTPIPTN